MINLFSVEVIEKNENSYKIVVCILTHFTSHIVNFIGDYNLIFYEFINMRIK